MPRKRNTIEVSTSLEVGNDELDLEIECEVSPHRPAKTYGPPEKCYPAEGGEVESWEVYELRGTKRIRREDLDDRFDADELMDLVERQADWGEDDCREDYDAADALDREEARAERDSCREDW